MEDYLCNPLVLYFKTNFDLQHIILQDFQWQVVTWYWNTCSRNCWCINLFIQHIHMQTLTLIII